MAGYADMATMGLAGQTGDLLGGYDRYTPQPPDIGKVGGNFRQLLNAYIKQAPKIYQEEAQYQPLYTQLGLENVQAARAAGVSGVGAVSPDIMSVERGYNPQVTQLLDTLGSQASDQLSQNGGLDPAMQRRVVQNVRSSQAARGLGYGPGDAAQEDYYLTNTMEQRREANQQFAANIGQLQEQYYKDPFSVSAAATTPVSAAPTIIPSNQSDAMMGTLYNARAAANIAGANNAAAIDSAY